MLDRKTITYSPSLTLPVTHSCAHRCLYCGFRKMDDGLLEMEEVDFWLDRAKKNGCSEVLILSGERVEEIESIRKEVQARGFPSFVDYVQAIGQKVLEKGLLPHTNIGMLDPWQLTRLREVNASMGLMLENVDIFFGKKVHPQKNIAGRIETLRIAGQLRIPFTTGIMVGLGESPESRFASLRIISDLHRRFGHIQEIILQNYVPNDQSTLPVFPLCLDEWKELISFAKQELPGVRIQIPPNLNPMWLDLIWHGVDDLGGISRDQDLVNPTSPWKDISFYRQELRPRGISLVPRLPIYHEFFKKGWYSRKVKEILDRWVNHDEFRYYCQ